MSEHWIEHRDPPFEPGRHPYDDRWPGELLEELDGMHGLCANMRGDIETDLAMLSTGSSEEEDDYVGVLNDDLQNLAVAQGLQRLSSGRVREGCVMKNAFFEAFCTKPDHF